MTDRPTIAPVRRQITVQADQERAFDFFTARMGSWWNPQHQIGERPFVDVVVEPREGGRWFERDGEDVECQWGEVLVWEPPGRVVLAWQLDATWSYDPDFVTELELRFVAETPSVTRVELEHRGMEAYGHAAPDIAAQLESGGGWGDLLARYAHAVASVGGRA